MAPSLTRIRRFACGPFLLLLLAKQAPAFIFFLNKALLFNFASGRVLLGGPGFFGFGPFRFGARGPVTLTFFLGGALAVEPVALGLFFSDPSPLRLLGLSRLAGGTVAFGFFKREALPLPAGDVSRFQD